MTARQYVRREETQYVRFSFVSVLPVELAAGVDPSPCLGFWSLTTPSRLSSIVFSLVLGPSAAKGNGAVKGNGGVRGKAPLPDLVAFAPRPSGSRET